MTIRAVLFDLDGVLVETYEAWFHLLIAATRDLGYPELSREQFKASWGQGIQADVDTIFRRHTVPEIEAYFEKHFVDHVRHMSINPESAPVFAALRAKRIPTAVITNTSSGLAKQILNGARLSPDQLVGGTDVPNAKPAPDMVLKACALLEVGPSVALVVGDSRFDREAAAAAKVRFAGYGGIEGAVTLKKLTDLLDVL